ncbi:hypothetical protein IEQ34_013087 [Dendrobium chrysotoxum]|uniref:Uncharacterized protein n=1 Tax=Dendrobium chrysotoxum TaxID=161865 RepID=A0AAV7GQC2_DENCH|nr:hypothetical protein IEQ34_013087 [Dendrobium chrysotoxum]
MSQLSVLVGGSDRSELIAFNEEEEAHVLKSWNTMKKDVVTLGLKFFLRLQDLLCWRLKEVVLDMWSAEKKTAWTGGDQSLEHLSEFYELCFKEDMLPSRFACLYSKLKFFASKMCIDRYGAGSDTAAVQDIDWH